MYVFKEPILVLIQIKSISALQQDTSLIDIARKRFLIASISSCSRNEDAIFEFHKHQA